MVVASTVGTTEVVAATPSDGPDARADGAVVATMTLPMSNAVVARQPINMRMSFISPANAGGLETGSTVAMNYLDMRVLCRY
jgi:hypothetical protein